MPLLGHVLRVGSYRSVERFAQDVGVAGVPTGLGEQVDEDVEQGHFGVVPRLWGSGRADLLHAAVLDGLSAQGSQTSYLWVLVENHRARSFYARRSWHETGVRELEVFEPFPEKMQMCRPLSREE